MTREERAALRALCEAAPPGPGGSADPVRAVRAGRWQATGPERESIRQAFSDSAIHRAARTALPALLDALDAAEARERESRRAALEEAARECEALAAVALGQETARRLRTELGRAERERDSAREVVAEHPMPECVDLPVDGCDRLQQAHAAIESAAKESRRAALEEAAKVCERIAAEQAAVALDKADDAPASAEMHRLEEMVASRTAAAIRRLAEEVDHG